MTKTPSRKKKQPPSQKASPVFHRKFWIGMCVVSSAWMFFFGLMVGRGTVPSQFDISKLERQLADLAHPDQKHETATEQKLIPKPDVPAPDLFEALNAPDPVLDIPDEKPKETALAKVSDSIKTKRPSPSLKKKKRGQTVAVSKQQTEPPKPSPPMKKKRLVVQAAAYKDLDAANEAVAALQQLGHRAYVASVEIKGKGIWHRVRLGPYDTNADADRALQRLKEKKIDGYIIQ